MGSDLAVLMPAFNEAQSIEQTIQGVLKYGVPVVVDDGSTDRTAELAKRAGARVIRLHSNQGYEAALNAGFAYCKAQQFAYLITFDADGQHPDESLSIFYQKLMSGIDLVVGQRDDMARWSERLFGYCVRRRFGIVDPLCGMKGYRMAFFQQYDVFDRYRLTGTELMLRGLRDGCSWVQVPILITPRLGVSRFGAFFRANARIVYALMRSFFVK